MKMLISILIVFLSVQKAKAQENNGRKDFLFENPVTKEQIRIEPGNKVSIRFKLPDVTTTGIVLSLSDSSLILDTHKEPYRQIVPFWNIASMTLIIEAKKRYIVRVALQNGKMLKGQLIHTTQDSVSILNTLNSQPTSVGSSEIRLIKIRRKKAVRHAIGIGAGTGGIIGGIIGYASTPAELTCSGCGPWNDFVHTPFTIIGGVIGAAAGSLVGLAIGSAGSQFKIEGKQAQFDLFAN